MSKYETRNFSFRAAKPSIGPDNRLSGQAAPFNSWTTIGGAFREQIAPGAFNKSIKNGDIVLLDNHDAQHPLARMSAGTLQLSADDRGLQWKAQPNDTSYASDVVKNVRAGNYGGCSFSFQPVQESWEEDTEDGIPERTLHEVKAREISIVTFPQYTDTSVANREMVELAFEYRDAFFGRVAAEYDAYRDDAPPKPYGDVKYADPKHGKYPIDDAAHAKAAWAFINQAKNAAFYPADGVTLSEVKNAIIAAAKRFGINIADGGGTSHSRGDMSFEEWQDWHELHERREYDAWAERAQEKYLRQIVRNHERIGREIAMDAAIHGRVTDPAAHAHRARIMREARNLSVQDDNPYEWRPMPFGKRGW